MSAAGGADLDEIARRAEFVRFAQTYQCCAFAIGLFSTGLSFTVLAFGYDGGGLRALLRAGALLYVTILFAALAALVPAPLFRGCGLRLPQSSPARRRFAVTSFGLGVATGLAIGLDHLA